MLYNKDVSGYAQHILNIGHWHFLHRLYSSAVFNDQFKQFAAPEIQCKSVDNLLLQVKAMSIYRIVNFPSPPDLAQVKSAERRLVLLGALKEPKSKGQYFTNDYEVSTYCLRFRFVAL
jgi:hypothetical protein